MTERPDLKRRALLGGSAAALALTTLPLRAVSETLSAAVAAEMRTLFGDRPIRDGRVVLTLPSLAENGNSVPLTVDVPDSPMSNADHVRLLAIFSPKNPLPNVARFYLGPYSGVAKVATRIRLSDSQTIIAVAEMNDGTLWSGSAEVVVTLAACIDLS